MLIRGVGDLLLGSIPVDRSHAGLQQLAGLLGEADLSLGNLEAPLVDTGIPISKIDIARADPEAADVLGFLGLKAVSLANNHIMDYGIDGLDATLAALKKARIAHAGAGHGQKAAFASTMVGSAAVLSACLYFKREWAHYTDPWKATPHVAGAAVIQGYEVETAHGTAIAPETANLHRLISAVKHARKRASCVVVMLHAHWGPHDIKQVDEGRSLAGRALIEAGADLVLGHGPHALNGVELHQGKPIVHSLGNFFFCIPAAIAELYPDARPFLATMTTQERFWLGLMAEYTPDRPLRLLPLELERSGPQQGMPRPAAGAAFEATLALLREQCEPLGTRVKVVNERFEVCAASGR